MRKKQNIPSIRNRYNFMLQVILVMMVLCITGCTNEFLSDEQLAGREKVILSLTTRADNTTTGSGNETVVNTLRLMIFNSSGAQIANSYYDKTLLDELRSSDGKTFTLTERLPRDAGQIKICLIANEPLNWNLGRTAGQLSYNVLTNMTVHYLNDFDFINNNGNVDDLNLYISPTDYFLMYAETAVNFVAGDMSIADVLPLKRTAAKVTLTLGYDGLTDVDYDNGEDFEVKSVSIQNQPIYSHLFAAAYDNDECFSTAYQSLEYDKVTKVTQPVVFYIPEYYLSSEAYSSNLFTYIEVLGEYTSGGVKMPITYKIPLGDGVQKIYTESNYTPSIGDYSVVRNHHYVVNARITKLGEKDGLQAQISIIPWADGGNVDVDASAPYLNVSDITQERTVFSAVPDINDKIFFWTNQPQSLIVLTPVTATYYDAGGSTMDISGLAQEFLPVIDVNMIKYSIPVNGNNFFENNGHVDVNVHLPATVVWSKLVLSFQVKAGNLKRLITITYRTMP